MSYGLFLVSLLRTRHLENVIGTTLGQWVLVGCVFLFLQCAGTVVWIAFGGNDEFSTSWNDSWWISYTLLVDIGTQTGLSARERGSIKFVSAVISLVGFVYFLTLLGMVVDLLRDFLNDMRMRFSSVRASNHWLILGWGDKTLLLIDELLTSIASAPPQRKCCGCGCRRRRQIVILADMPTQQMADEVQVHCLADPLLQRITTLFLPVVCYKQGNPTDISELLSVSAPNARDILVARTSENGHLSDLKAISALLALAAMPADSPVNGDVWVEVCQEQSLRTVKTILPDSHGIVARKVVNRMMVLRALVPSVGFVFLSMTSASFATKSTKSQLLTPTLGRGPKGAAAAKDATLPQAKLHLVPAPSCVCGVPFSEVGRFFPDAVVCGVNSGVTARKSIIPGASYVLQAQDVLVLLAPNAAAAKRCVVPRPTSAATVAPEESKGLYLAESLVKSDGQLRLGPAADGPKVVLVLGCPGAGDIAEILDTIDVHVSSGSSVHILSRTPVAEREEWILQHLKMTGRSNFDRISVQQYEGESTNKWDMTKLPLASASCALILAERLRDDESTLAVDSRNLTSAIFLKQKLDELIQASGGAMPRSVSTATNMTVMTTFTDASGPSTAAGSRGKKCKMVTELLDAKSETVLDGNAGVRKQGSFMYTNARETAIYALAVEHREVYELFIQLADPYCGIGFVTVAPIHHYVTGIEDLSYHQLQRRVWNSCKGVLLGWRDFTKFHPELNPDQKDEVIEWDDMGNLELIILRPPDEVPDQCRSPSVQAGGLPRT